MRRDSLVKYIDNTNNMRIISTDATITVDDARIRHRLFPIPSIALGRLLIGGLLMASTLKEEAVVSLKIEGDGPLDLLTVDASYEGYVRGYCSSPQLDIPMADGANVSGVIGKGHLYVKKKIERNSHPYTGVVDLYTGEIGEDIAYYYYYSEQLPTALSLGVYVGEDGRVSAAGGILVQALPPQEESFLKKLEMIFARSPSITTLTREEVDADGIVQAYLPGFELERLEQRSPMFKCSCNKEATKRALAALGIDELRTLLEEGSADITCDYCGQHYYYFTEDLQKLIDELKNGS